MKMGIDAFPCRAIALALAVSAAAGCATPPRRQFTYPAPPDKARVEFVRSFNKPQDIRTSILQRMWSAIVPYEPSNLIANPAGIALSKDERFLYVAIPKSHRVVKVDLESGTFSAIGTGGEKRLQSPAGVAVDDDDRVYVADKKLGAVVVFDRNGKLTTFIGRERLSYPNAVAIDRKAQILYVVNDAVTQEGRHTVEAFSLGGNHLRTLGGGKGGADGLFVFPSGVAVSSQGELFVADTLNFRVQVFDREGRFLRKFGEPGRGAGFDKIHGIAFDTFGNIFIADSMQGVQILNPQAQPLMGFGGGALDIPMYVAIDSRNHIYVSDLTYGIVEFKLVNTSAEDSYGSPAAAQTPPPAPQPAAAPPADVPASP